MIGKAWEWVGRVPVAIWLVLLLTQVVSLIAGSFRLAELDRDLVGLANWPSHVIDQYEAMRSRELFRVIGAACYAALFLALAWRRWNRNNLRKTG